MSRRSIPATTRRRILLEGGYKCANPSCRHVLTLELHHIEWVRDGGGNEPANLLALCPNCHALHTKGEIPREAIEVWKGFLTALNDPNRNAADVLLILRAEEERREAGDPEKTPPKIRFTGDSLSFLAGLITSGLVEISRRFLGGGYWGGSHPSFEVALTEKGRNLVDAWTEGDVSAVRKAMGGDPGGEPEVE